MHKLLTFNNERLLRQALTHRSYINENPGEKGDNERLEFLGDAILNFLSGEYLYQQKTEMAEGEMTRRRAALVDEKQLARFATEVGLDLRMRLGKGTILDGGFQNPNLLSSTFEAVVGAYYLDNNRNVDVLRPLLEELFNAVPVGKKQIRSAQIRSNLDPKNIFQEIVQANGAKAPPTYETDKIGGTDHAPEYSSKVYVDGVFRGEGRGKSKREAERHAAENASARLKKQGLI